MIVQVIYADKRFKNQKMYMAPEVYCPEDWTLEKIRDWFYERHSYLCEKETIKVMHTIPVEHGYHVEYFPE